MANYDIGSSKVHPVHLNMNLEECRDKEVKDSCTIQIIAKRWGRRDFHWKDWVLQDVYTFVKHELYNIYDQATSFRRKQQPTKTEEKECAHTQIYITSQLWMRPAKIHLVPLCLPNISSKTRKEWWEPLHSCIIFSSSSSI